MYQTVLGKKGKQHLSLEGGEEEQDIFEKNESRIARKAIPLKHWTAHEFVGTENWDVFCLFHFSSPALFFSLSLFVPLKLWYDILRDCVWFAACLIQPYASMYHFVRYEEVYKDICDAAKCIFLYLIHPYIYRIHLKCGPFLWNHWISLTLSICVCVCECEWAGVSISLHTDAQTIKRLHRWARL